LFEALDNNHHRRLWGQMLQTERRAFGFHQLQLFEK
jgi:hypothetical protein